MKILRRMLYTVIFIVSATWLLLVILIYTFQSRLIFYPERTLLATPADLNLPYEDVLLKTEDGKLIHGWYIRHGAPRATVLFLHGNAGNISHRLESLEMFYRMGMSVFIIDYHGFGRSEGSPGENETYLDAAAAWKYMTLELKLPARDLVIFGRSLGGAVAVWLASRHRPGALIIESTFTSVAEMGKRYYPYLPADLLTRIRYPTIDRIAGIDCPLLVIHGRNDEIIPFEFGQKLYQSAREPKEFLELMGGHNDGFLVSGEKYFDGLQRFIYANTAH